MAIWSAWPATTTDAFTVRCDCGAQVGGQRETTCQSVTCPACGQRVFALPKSPYPQPVPPADHPDARRLAAERRARRLALLKFAAGPAIALGQRTWAWCTPLRMAVIGVCVLAVLTLWLTWQSIQRQRYVALLPNALAAGSEALENGNFYEACEQLRAADTAARWLGGDKPQEIAAQNLYLEALGWSHLSSSSPRDICDQAQQAGPAFADTFARQHAGPTLVIDAWVRAELGQAADADSEPPRVGHIDYVVYGADYRGRLVIDQPPWLNELAIGEERRFTFVAPMKSIGPDDGNWVIRLDGTHSVMLTRSGPLRRQGWNVDEQLHVTLGPPSDLAGQIKPEPDPATDNARVGVAAGDDELDVVRRLPRPDRVSRVAVLGRTDEQWVFLLTGLHVDLERKQSRDAARVVAVHVRGAP